MSGTTSGVGGPGTSYTVQNDPPPPQAGPVMTPSTQIAAGDFDPVPMSGATLGLAAPMMPTGMDMAAMVLALKQSMEQLNIKTAKTEIEDVKEQKAAKAQERLDSLAEQAKSGQDAAKAGLAGEIFSWIASIAMIIAGAILCATGVGAAAGAALLAGGITMAVMTALQSESLGKAVGLEGNMMTAMVTALADHFVSAYGMDPEKAKAVASGIIVGVLAVAAFVGGTASGNPLAGLSLVAQVAPAFFTPENFKAMGVKDEKLAMGLSIGFSVGFAIAGAAAGFGAAKLSADAAKTAADAVAKTASATADAAEAAAKGADVATDVADVVNKAVDVAVDVGTSTSRVGRIAPYIAQGVQAAATAGQGTATIIAADANYDAAQAQAMIKELTANMSKLQQYFDDQTEKLDEIIQRLQDSYGLVMNVMNESSRLDHKINAMNAV